ncbi:ABC transporter ATP-binding protein [Egicoccus halophilus]|uniref:ABC transporter ATP-binding protein n=1 Tax=Egicoccus halophilus TaxID=1670830 RepID=A0A8J3EWV7_9ACTN|nr:ABC transporter ATP-binding protein [Egicoccus halophilus]GGI04513.1 ABC transporter ATP-binding protein [Egicoccus halophilus]
MGSEPQFVDAPSARDVQPLLSVRDLVTEFKTGDGVVHAVDGVSYEVYPGETLGVVGESGSGKSVTVMSILGLIPQPPGRIANGEIILDGQDLLQLSSRELRQVRGKDVAMIFQDPMTSLNPVLSVGDQLAEAILVHEDVSEDVARKRVVELLELVGVPNADQRFDQYPHEYSGGMRQRAMIAMAMANRPKLLIADEPTTALDVTIQAQVLEVLQAAKEETNAGVILITHDLGVVAEMADRVVVMYGGRVVETGTVDEIFHSPKHPYTLGLLSSLPRPDQDLERLVPIPGQPPSLINLPSGCAFHPRCHLGRGRSRCRTEEPALYDLGPMRGSRCHFHEEMAREVAEVEKATGARIEGSEA